MVYLEDGNKCPLRNCTPWTEQVHQMTPTERLAWMMEHDPAVKQIPSIEDGLDGEDRYVWNESEPEHVPGSAIPDDEFVPTWKQKPEQEPKPKKRERDWREADAERVLTTKDNGDHKSIAEMVAEQMIVDFEFMMSFPNEFSGDRDYLNSKKLMFHHQYGRDKFKELYAKYENR